MEQVAEQLVTEIVAPIVTGNSVSSSYQISNGTRSTSFDPSAMIDELNKNVQMLTELQ